jgi:hypothetical protein
MGAICSSENLKKNIRRYIPEDSTLYNKSCENLKSYMTKNNLKLAAYSLLEGAFYFNLISL